MKISMSFITTLTVILVSTQNSATYGQNSNRGRINRLTEKTSQTPKIDQDQEWDKIEINEKSIAFFGWYGTMYNRRYDNGDLAKYTEYFNKHFKYENNGTPQSLDDCTVQVKMDFIKTFFDQAKVLGNYNSNQDFTGIKIIYGMEGRKLIMIFQPLILKRTFDMDYGGYYYDAVLSSNCYKINNNGSLDGPHLLQDYQGLIDGYQAPNSKIYMEKITTDSHKFINGTSTSSCTLALQDVIEVYLHNINTQIPDLNAQVTFSFVASLMTTNDPNQADWEQHIVVSHRPGQLENDGVHKFRSYALDYSQLCPPQCDRNIWIYTDN
jgi:hypothetical protein